MDFLIPLAILVYSAILHEVMHGWVANKLGDPTAKVMGRLTLNPIPHIDPIMSIALPAILILSGSPIIFGAAKPVPVNPMYFKDPRKDLALTGLAGPLTNLVIAIIAGVIFRLLFPSISLSQLTQYISHGIFQVYSLETLVLFSLGYTIFINLVLGILNLIPIPPLDGSKVFSIFLPEKMAISYMSIGQFGIFILFFLLMFPLGPFSLGSLINNWVNLAIKVLGN